LLVLDNLEHLLEASTLLVRQLLDSARGIHIMATSQVRLRLRAEWILELNGLLCGKSCKEDTSSADWSCSAAQLFRQTAGRLCSDFSLAAELPHVCHICRLVEGLPLGIELAASFVREGSCAQVALEIQEDLDFVSTCIPDLPPRQRSLRAVFEHAWKLMNQEDRLIYQRLAVFHDSFTLEAARQVTKATTSQIIRLRERSLLQQVAEGRYELHNILRHFAAEKLRRGCHSIESDPDWPLCTGDAAAGRIWLDLAGQHGRYYLNFLRQRHFRLRGSEQKAAARVAGTADDSPERIPPTHGQIPRESGPVADQSGAAKSG
jgi:predicted ATPase